ncbi:hypothetical protein Pcinc_022182 [Petrolisthes cinctipes]|uniref:adenylate cyclase n=1 Tax=Petrolisthes cinctipes TaxID=88211 RepID=A0AAE1FE70_PETCI|nr:hypothetical protein Pcinc_022182 [Petrolisthes cinctipes]
MREDRDSASSEEGAGGGAEAKSVEANGRPSIGSATFDDSPRSSADVNRPFDVMARNSLSSLQQRRQSSASAYIKEPLTATNDDRNWSWGYLRSRFKLKELEGLFDKYQLRLHHAMLLVYLFLQLSISTIFIIALALSMQRQTEEDWGELTGHVANLIVCIALLVYVYNENTFRQFPRLHIVMSGLVVLTLFTSDVALTIYFKQNTFPGHQYTNVKYGNMVYLLLVVYVFLPIPRKVQVMAMALLLSGGDLALTYYTTNRDNPTATPSDITTKLVVEAVLLVSVNLVGVYWTFMSEVAFRRAFLDKRGHLESKFKLDAEKKQEETLLLSVLPKNIMGKVKDDFRKMIANADMHENKPVSKSNPFSNLYLTYHDMVSILYADIVNFTPLTTKLSGDQLVGMLNHLFGKFDEAAEVRKEATGGRRGVGECIKGEENNKCERIKILGDCYYCVSGVPEFTENHANNCVKVGLDMIDIIREVREERRVNVDMRIGIHSGSVLSGLIGMRKWQFDVWGNDVTIANHMEQTGQAGQIHVTHKTRELLAGQGYDFKPSRARQKDELLDDEKIDTFLITPKPRQKPRRGSYAPQVSIKQRVSVSTDPEQLRNLYVGDMTQKITKVQLPHGAPRPSILNRRRSTHTEGAMANKRRAVVTDTSTLANFQRIMVDSKESMEKAIESMPLRKYDQWFKPEGINPVLLTFKERKYELKLLSQADPLYKYYVLCATLVFAAIFIVQECLMLRNAWGWVAGGTCLVLLVVVMPLVWVSSLHQRIVDPHDDIDYDPSTQYPITRFFYASSKLIISCTPVRVGLYLIVCTSLYISAIINVVECKSILEMSLRGGGNDNYNLTSTTTTTTTSTSTSTSTLTSTPTPTDIPALCCDPWYFTYSTTLTLLVAWTFFRMHYLFKGFIYLVVVSVYGYFALHYAEEMYNHHHLNEVCPPLIVTSLTLSPGMGHFTFVVMIFFALHVLDRQMEYILRLDFLWKQQLEAEKKEAEDTREANKLLLENILPVHVAEMFLTNSAPSDELYHESYDHVSVIFASIPGYSNFYRENVNVEDGRMCLNVLTEIICDFDTLTYHEEFSSVEKIKVVGSTYMAACGLQPGRRCSDESNYEERDKYEIVSTITKFAAAMFKKLDALNDEIMHTFKLRVGIDVGPVIAGVVGQHKPMYDIWGNTVNVASRMDYTGQDDKIHVTSEVGEILRELGWSVECRGEIYVKGKGAMTTYFVDPMSDPHGPMPLTVPGYNNNNNQRRKSSQDRAMRRRSSQMSMNALKAILAQRHGSLDISRHKDPDSVSSKSLPLSVYRPIHDDADVISHKDKERVKSAGATPRSSVDDIIPQLVPAIGQVTTTTPAVVVGRDKPVDVSQEYHTSSSNHTNSSLSHLSADSTRAMGSSDLSSHSARSSTAGRLTPSSSNQDELDLLLDRTGNANLERVSVASRSPLDSSQTPTARLESNEQTRESYNNNYDDNYTSITIEAGHTHL